MSRIYSRRENEEASMATLLAQAMLALGGFHFLLRSWQFQGAAQFDVWQLCGIVDLYCGAGPDDRRHCGFWMVWATCLRATTEVCLAFQSVEGCEQSCTAFHTFWVL